MKKLLSPDVKLLLLTLAMGFWHLGAGHQEVMFMPLVGLITALVVGGLAAAGTVGAAAISSSAGGAGGAGGAGALDADAMMKLIKDYQKRVDEGVDEYDTRLGGAITGYQSAADTSIANYTQGMTDNIAAFNKRQNKVTKNYLKNVNRLTKDPVGDYVLPAANQALAFNEANAGRFGQLAGQLSASDQATRFAQLDAAMPSWRTERDKAAQINASLLNGEIPTDVKQKIARDSAYKSLQGGFGSDSGVGRSLRARDLAMTSLDLQQRGQQNAQSWDDLLYRIAVPQQTTAADVMNFAGISGQTAAGAALVGMNARVGAQGAAFTNRSQTANTTLAAQTTMAGSVLNSNLGVSRDIFGALDQQAANIFGVRTQTAGDIANASMGVVNRQATDAQAAANYTAQQNAQLANTAAAGIGAAGGALSSYYQNRGSVTGVDSRLYSPKTDYTLTSKPSANAGGGD